MNVTLILFYLLLLFLPTQLGRHFFFDFSSIAGYRSDYLAPTIFLTDIVVFFMIIVSIKNRLGKGLKRKFTTGKFLIVSSVFILVFNSIFIAVSPFIALYKTVKITEFIILGYLIVKIKPKISAVCGILSFDVLYTSLIAIFQFIYQRSLGGMLWWLGERSFNSQTPGIAAESLWGQLMLRPYSVFPHPNVLGGFLAVILPLLFLFLIEKSRKYSFQFFWYSLCMIVGFIGLVLSFSKLAWFVALVGFVMIFLSRKKIFDIANFSKEKLILICFYILIFVTSTFPLFIPDKLFKNESSWGERYNLLQTAISMGASHPFWGVGLNNFVVQAYTYVSHWDLYYFQPVHNIYMLTFAETGLVGFSILIIFLAIVFRKTATQNKLVIISIVQIYLLGVFDHYLFTLQQGMLLFTLITSLAFLRDNK